MSASDGGSDFRLLFVTLEFTFSPFSGNGLYARSLVKSILRTGKCSVRVICGKPHPSIEDLSDDNPINVPEITTQQQAALELLPVDLPAGSWNKLDRLSPWGEFSRGASAYAGKVAEWEPDVAVVVDWHGGAAWKQIRANWLELPLFRTQPPKVCYFNFRVYSSGIAHGDFADEMVEWYEERERNALALSSDVICLSRGDCESLTRLLPPLQAGTDVRLLHPALREDMRLLAAQPTQSLLRSLHPEARRVVSEGSSRIFVTCCVRLSEEKNPILFCQIMELLRDFIAEKGLVPLLCGSASHQEYALTCRERLLSACPTAVIISDFMGPRELAAIFSNTLINFHPCLYDAYGMTAVEAAAFGAPSVINGNNSVGATELLGHDGFFPLNMEGPINKLAESFQLIVDDLGMVNEVGTLAKEKAQAWSEDASAKTILGFLGQLKLPN